MIKKLPWLRMLKKTDWDPPLRLPIACGPVSNGEGWWPDTKRKKVIRQLVLAKADEVARKEGVDRREFMASACGMATTLAMINLVNGCGSEKSMGGGGGVGVSGGTGVTGGTGGTGVAGGAGGAGPVGGPGGTGSVPVGGTGAGGFSGLPPEAPFDEECAQAALGGRGELVIDMQSHFATPETNPFGALGLSAFVGQINNTRFPWIVRSPGVGGSGQFDRNEYIAQILMGSDTTIGVLSGISYSLGADGTGTGGFAALSNEDLIGGVNFLDSQFPGRVLSHAMVMPNDRIDVQLAMMERNAGTYTNWKTYPPWGAGTGPLPEGYWLNEGPGPQMLQKGIDLGAPIFCIHKGFPLSSFSPTYTNPKDVGPAARMFPQAHFVIYHSAFEHGMASGQSSEPTSAWTEGSVCPQTLQLPTGMWPEGPYDEADAAVQAMYPLDRGVNSLIKSLRDSNIGPNGTDLDNPNSGPTTNVYAETGGVWMNLLTGRAEEAQHYWGKLLKHIGEDRIVWGTDCLWFGSPQPAIEAFRCFEISQQFQDTYGYPALTQARKEKILGQNAARLQSIRDGVSISGCHTDFVAAKHQKLKKELDEEFGPRRDMVVPVWGPRSRREFLALNRHEYQEKLAWSGNITPGQRA